MQLEWRQLGDELVHASSQCKKEMVLVAPFMKAETLQRIIELLSPSASLLCLTRWRLEEIAIGVSDLECWDVISRRNNSRLLLLSNLHAKYFRFDDVAFLGSANLTMTALGWSTRPNAEALVQCGVNDLDSIPAFEQSLLAEAVNVTPDLVAEFKAMLANCLFEKPNVQPQSIQEEGGLDKGAIVRVGYWVPRSRSPEYLYHVYCGDHRAISKAGQMVAKEDLLDLDLPPGLSEPAFSSVVQSRLVSTPIVIKLNEFLTVRRRFGEIRSWLAERLGVKDATDDWQCLMRWLLFFVPERYESATPGYSELFGRKAIS